MRVHRRLRWGAIVLAIAGISFVANVLDSTPLTLNDVTAGVRRDGAALASEAL